MFVLSLDLVCDIPTYYPSYLTESFCAYVLVLKFYLIYLFLFIYLFLLIFFLGKLVLITTGILRPCPLLSRWFTVCFSTFNGNMLPLMTLEDLYRGGPAYFQSNVSLVEGAETAVAFNLVFEVCYFICIKCSSFYLLSMHSSNVERQRGLPIELLYYLWV